MSSPVRARTFVVAEPDTTLASVVERLAPGDPSSIEDGRVFVDRQRVKEPWHRLAPGAQVTWYLRRSLESSNGDVAFSIVERRGDWVIAAKPAMWACEPDRTGNGTSLRDAVAAELRVSEAHVLTRLDVGVSGLVLLGLTHRVCSIAAQMQRQHQITKEYFGLATGSAMPSTTWNGPPSATREATTEVRTIAVRTVRMNQENSDKIALLNFKPITGRKHQIRIHASHYGLPLLGDARYGGLTRLVKDDGTVTSVPRIMLHAYRLNIPWKQQTWVAFCAVPVDFVQLWTGVGGDVACLQP